LDLPHEISTLIVRAVGIEISKRVEMRIVNGFVALFLPTGLVACASGPLFNAALNLMDNVYNLSKSRVNARGFNPYHCGYEGNRFIWDRVKVFMEDNADVVLVREPRDIDNFLDYGVSIWITWAPAKVEIL
jgi:hypothetical protein